VNTAHIISLLLQVKHLVAGHHFRPWLWIGCTTRQSPQVITHLHTAGCTVIRVTQRSIQVNW
jgi:hypothetical protein